MRVEQQNQILEALKKLFQSLLTIRPKEPIYRNDKIGLDSYEKTEVLTQRYYKANKTGAILSYFSNDLETVFGLFRVFLLRFCRVFTLISAHFYGPL